MLSSTVNCGQNPSRGRSGRRSMSTKGAHRATKRSSSTRLRVSKTWWKGAWPSGWWRPHHAGYRGHNDRELALKQPEVAEDVDFDCSIRAAVPPKGQVLRSRRDRSLQVVRESDELAVCEQHGEFHDIAVEHFQLDPDPVR